MQALGLYYWFMCVKYFIHSFIHSFFFFFLSFFLFSFFLSSLLSFELLPLSNGFVCRYGAFAYKKTARKVSNLPITKEISTCTYTRWELLITRNSMISLIASLIARWQIWVTSAPLNPSVTSANLRRSTSCQTQIGHWVTRSLGHVTHV